MKAWIRTILARRREKQRNRLLALIGRDIENIAHDAYREGCYVTTRRMQAEKALELMRLMQENEKMREMMIERMSVTMPPVIIKQESK